MCWLGCESSGSTSWKVDSGISSYSHEGMIFGSCVVCCCCCRTSYWQFRPWLTTLSMTDNSLVFITGESRIHSTVVEMRRSGVGGKTPTRAVMATRTPAIANPDLDKDIPLYCIIGEAVLPDRRIYSFVLFYILPLIQRGQRPDTFGQCMWWWWISAIVSMLLLSMIRILLGFV